MRRVLLKLGLGVCLLLALVNGAVRLAGGAPFLLSPLYLEDKVRALGLLALHAVPHVLGSCDADLRPMVASASRRHGLPEDFVWSIARAESLSLPHAISHAGAMGAFQLTPGRARLLGVRDPFDPAENTEAAARHLAELWRRYSGDRRRVAAAYNAGPGAVPRTGPVSLPGETRIYVKKVCGAPL